MNKVYVHPPNESWIVDRLVNEFNNDNQDIVVSDPRDADVVWLMANWCSDQLDGQVLTSKKLIQTVHHIVPEKFGPRQVHEFLSLDRLTTVYHVPNHHTYDFIRPLTTKPIHTICYWANQHLFKRSSESPADLRKKHGLPIEGILIGSFQRDTEGVGVPQGIYSPKYEKGPDLFADAVVTYKKRCEGMFQVEVVLAGWRRQYLMRRLNEIGVRYHYFERPQQSTLIELYQCLNLYPVTSRQEGGPQSFIECGLLGIPCVSRDVGIAGQVLPSDAIKDDVSSASPCIPNVDRLKLPGGYVPFRKLIGSL